MIKFYKFNSFHLHNLQIKALLYTSDLPYDKYLNQLYDLDYINKDFHPAKLRMVAIQPYSKWVPSYKVVSNQYLRLEELVSLIHSLPYYNVVYKKVIPLKNLDHISSSKIMLIKEMIGEDFDCMAVGVDKLPVDFYLLLREIYCKPIYDRYNLVLKIFKYYANTKESKIQIALADIPYQKLRLKMYQKLKMSKKKLHEDSENLMIVHQEEINFDNFCQDDSISWHDKVEIINMHEDKLRKMLNKITTHNYQNVDKISLKPLKSEKLASIPIIAIVGYTNSGKTSLIKVLAEKGTKLVPENRLFATLNVSLHEGRLPYLEKVLYLDTIGFISDIPTELITAFKTTLKEINRADLIVHVRDISHPDRVLQNSTVLETLKALDIRPQLLDTMIVIDNKTDLLNEDQLNEISKATTPIAFPVSVLKNEGLVKVVEFIHTALFRILDKVDVTLRFPISQYHKVYSFLNGTNSSIIKNEPSEDAENYIIQTKMDKKSISLFKAKLDPSFIMPL